jgi:hypothetical protein
MTGHDCTPRKGAQEDVVGITRKWFELAMLKISVIRSSDF